MTTIDPKLINELNALAAPEKVLKTLHDRFGGRMAVGTSGQRTGSAIIALCVEAGFKPRVFTNDTGRLFPETYALFDAIEKKYALKIERFAPAAEAVDKMVAEHGEYLFFDAKEKQEYCCHIRKVVPNRRALDTVDVWVTGLRADQSLGRAKTPRFEIIQHEQDGKKRPLLKVAPLVDWTEERLRDYLKKNGAPVHPLLEKKLPGGWYYESLGCVMCTTPIGPFESRRAGRWRWFVGDKNKECGLHVPPPPADGDE